MAEQKQRNYKIPGFAWLVGVVLVIVYEVWALLTKNPTLSAWVWKQDTTYPWFKWVVLIATVYLMYHFFWPRK